MKKHIPAILILILVPAFLLLPGCASIPVRPGTGIVTFLAAGDVMLDRGVKARMKKSGDRYPFRDVSVFIKKHDLAFCNFEGPISKNGKKKPKKFAFRFDPSLSKGLKASGFNMFSLANNHTLDYGGRALRDTLDFMEENGYFYAGAGRDQKSAGEIKYREINGIKFAFISNLDMFLSSEDKDAPQAFERCKIGEMADKIKEADNNADYVLVSFHWGAEYKNYPGKRQKEYARACVDAGADLVIGHHPHVMQGIETYKGKTILYSLGNFIFDQTKLATNEAMVFSCTFTRQGIQDKRLLPLKIIRGRPKIASGAEARALNKKIEAYSKNFNVEFENSGDKMVIK